MYNLVNYLNFSLKELKLSIFDVSWYVLSTTEIKMKYRRTILGPFWISASIGTQIFVMGFLLAHLFNQPVNKFLPFICTSIIFWSLLKDSIQDLSTGFISMTGVIMQSNRPLMIYVLLNLYKNVLITLHFIPILVIVLLSFNYKPSIHYILIIPGLLIFLLNIFWIGLLTAVISARYRDIPQIIANGLLVIVWLAPIYYQPSQVGKIGQLVNKLNPVTYIIEIIRGPILNTYPPISYWIISLIFAIFGILVSFIFYAKYNRKIALWL